MDTNNEIRLRLRFYKDVEENRDIVLNKFESFKTNHAADCRLKIKYNHIWMNITEAKREYWSPHLHLELESTDNKGTHIRGLFGPDPTLWTFFIFLHCMVAGVFVIFAGMAYYDHIMKISMTMDFVVMAIVVLIWFLLYFSAKQIRVKGNNQMNELEEKFLAVLDLKD